MSKHHCWYVIGRSLRLALAYALLASLFVANPAFAVEDTELTAKKTAISNGSVTAADSAATAPHPVDAEQESFAQTVAEPSAAALDFIAPAAGTLVDGVFVLPKTGEVFPAVLELKRKSETITRELIGREKDFEYYLPVAEMGRILKFPSRLDSSALRIQGSFLDPKNTYSIDATTNTYTVKGETHPLPEGAALTGSKEKLEDLFIKIDVLNEIWPLEMELNTFRQSVNITTNRKLPYELERERKRRQEKLDRERQKKEERDKFQDKFNYHHNGYRLLGPQTFFLSERLKWDNDTRDLRNSFFVTGTGDLLGASGAYSLNFSKTEKSNFDLDDFTIRLRRDDYNTGKLLPFRIDRVDAGDITLRSPSLVTGSLQGTGLFLSTKGNNQNVDFDEVVIEGTAEPGWDIEVYSRGVLLDFGITDDLGRYRFENIPLTYGRNVIRIILYGPQGQIEERTESYNIARSILKPGEITYQAGIVKRGDRVINVSDTRENDGEYAGTLKINRGINEHISGFATFSNIDLNAKREKYVSVGANFNAFGGFGQVEAYKQIDRGTAYDFRYANTFFGLDTNIRSTVFRDFESQRTGLGDNKRKTENSISIVKRFPQEFASLNLGLSLDHTTFEEDVSDTRASTSQSFKIPFGNISHTTSSTFRGGDHIVSDGQVSFGSQLFDHFSFNSRLSYDYFPERQLESYDLSLGYTNDDRLSASLGYGQSLIETSSRTASLGIGYDFDAFRGNFDMDWGSTNGIDFTLGASTTLGPEGEEGTYAFRRKLKGQRTRLSVRLFEDLNNNGVYDPEHDTPVPGARVALNGGKVSPLTDENGFVEIAPAGGEGLTFITLDRKYLTYNPFLISAKKNGHATILRAGTNPHIDFPLTMAGGIDGTVRNENGSGMSATTVQLINAHGKLVAETKTIGDGFYAFELLRPGRYVVQVHPSHRVFVPPRTVRVASDDLFAYGVDLQVLSNQVQEQAKEAAVADDVRESGRVAHTYHHSEATVGTEKPAQSEHSDGGVQPVVGMISDSGVQSAIRAVRIGEHPDKVRLVLDLSSPAEYSITQDPSGTAVTVDLPNTGFETQNTYKAKKRSLFTGLEVNPGPNGGTRLKLTGKHKVEVYYDTILPAEAGRPDRMYIDFVRAQ